MPLVTERRVIGTTSPAPLIVGIVGGSIRRVREDAESEGEVGIAEENNRAAYVT